MFRAAIEHNDLAMLIHGNDSVGCDLQNAGKEFGRGERRGAWGICHGWVDPFAASAEVEVLMGAVVRAWLVIGGGATGCIKG